MPCGLEHWPPKPFARQRPILQTLAPFYSAWHARIYRNRLWVNQLARLAVLHPKISSTLFELLRFYPAPLKYLTSKVVAEKRQEISLINCVRS